VKTDTKKKETEKMMIFKLKQTFHF